MADAIRVLYVEGDPEVAARAAEGLERAEGRFEVLHAESARAAHERLAEEDVDCVVSEYELPDGTGIELLEGLREEHPDLPFVLFTDAGSEAVASEAIRAGVTDYVGRGGDDRFAALATRIADAVEGHRSRESQTDQTRELRIYERIFNTMEGGACLYDTEGRFRIVNDYLVDFYGRSREDLVGERSGLIDRIREEGEGDPYEELIEGERDVLEGEIEIVKPEVGTVVVEYRLTPLRDEDTVEGVVAVARDVTERVERERRLEEFASVVSHDLRNPLTVARSRLELAQAECDSDHLDDVARAQGRMDELIDELLTLSREGDRPEERAPVDLATLVESCWSTVRTGEATLSADVEGRVVADRSRLQQLFENLIRNAVEHGDDGVTVTVGTTEDGFYVEDDGPGIQPDRREDLFEAGRGTEEGGAGIGLSIVKRVAEEHGWTVGVTEGADGGARFEVRGVDFVEGE